MHHTWNNILRYWRIYLWMPLLELNKTKLNKRNRTICILSLRASYKRLNMLETYMLVCFLKHDIGSPLRDWISTALTQSSHCLITGLPWTNWTTTQAIHGHIKLFLVIQSGDRRPVCYHSWGRASITVYSKQNVIHELWEGHLNYEYNYTNVRYGR